MARGRRFEDTIAQLFAASHQEYQIEHNRNKTQTPEYVEHKEYNYLIGHPDRLIFDESGKNIIGGLEIKTSNIANIGSWGADGTDEIPENYQLQCQWYAGLMGLDQWTLAVAFLDDNDKLRAYREHPIYPKKKIYETLVNKAVEFWEESVLPGIPPEIDADSVDEMTRRWILERFPKNNNPLETATFEEESIIHDYLAAKKNKMEAEAILEKIELKLKMAIGNRDGLISDDFGKVTWKLSKDSQRVDYKGIVEELNPQKEIIDRYTKTTPGSRRFETKGLKLR